MAGLPDITVLVKNKSQNYKECIYESDPQETINKVKDEIDHCTNLIKQAGAITIFCTVTHANLKQYNESLLSDNKTAFLKYTSLYANMQPSLNHTIDEINRHIAYTNKLQSVATPHCHSAIRKRSGNRGGRYILNWKGLRDGVHGTAATRMLWAKAISSSIRLNRKKLDSSNDDSDASPKRSWRRDTSTPSKN